MLPKQLNLRCDNSLELRQNCTMYTLIESSITQHVPITTLQIFGEWLMGRFELFMPQVVVERVMIVEQLAVCALLAHPAAVQHQDLIGVLDGRQAVRDDDGGALLCDAVQGTHNTLW